MRGIAWGLSGRHHVQHTFGRQLSRASTCNCSTVLAHVCSGRHRNKPTTITVYSPRGWPPARRRSTGAANSGGGVTGRVQHVAWERPGRPRVAPHTCWAQLACCVLRNNTARRAGSPACQASTTALLRLLCLLCFLAQRSTLRASSARPLASNKTGSTACRLGLTLRASSARPDRPGWPTRLSFRGPSSTMCITDVHSLCRETWEKWSRRPKQPRSPSP